jgi:hypothetical protein
MKPDDYETKTTIPEDADHLVDMKNAEKEKLRTKATMLKIDPRKQHGNPDE